MNLVSLAAGVILLGAGLGPPELPALLERGGAEMGLDLTLERLSVPEGAKPPDASKARDLLLSPAEPSPVIWRDTLVRFSPESRPWVLQGWPETPPGPGEPGFAAWREELAELAAQASARGRDLSPKARIIPAAQALGLAVDAIEKGALPGLKDPSALYRAGGGLNDRGLYLVAMTTLASLSGRSPEGLPAKLTRFWMSRDSVVTDPMARALQTLAWKAASAAVEAPAAAPLTPTQVLGGVTAPGIGFNLFGLADWSPQLPFLDLMKTARRWGGLRSDHGDGVRSEVLEAEGWLDAEGWPRQIPPGLSGLMTLIFADLSPEATGIAGRYHLRHQGRGRLALEGPVEIVSQAPGEIVFDYRPVIGNVMLILRETDPADPVRAITIVRADRLERHARGEIFNPDWLLRLRGAEMLRFMDWMQANFTEIAGVDDQPRVSDYSYTRRGVPLEVLLSLSAELGADPWLTLPHLTSDALARDLALRVRDGLAPGRKVYLELSNEVWNHMFPQAQWAEKMGRARWGREWTWVQFYALRAAEIAEIWREVFAQEPERLVRVLGTQIGWLGLERDILDAPLVVAEGRAPPHVAFDALAVTGYVGGGLGSEEKRPMLEGWLTRSRAAAEAEAARLGLSGRTAAAHVEAHRFDLAMTLALEEMRDGRHYGSPNDTLRRLLEEELPWQAAAARERGLRLVMYEGGTHAAGHGPSREIEDFTAFFIALNYSAGMGRLYRDLIDGWRAVSDAPFAAFVDVAAPSKYGAWGALRHLGDDNPRWRALANGTNE